MNRLKNRLTFTLILLCAIVQSNTLPFFIPTTISEEAQQQISKWTVEGRDAWANFPNYNDSKEEWASFQKKNSDNASQHIPHIINKYTPSIDTLQIGGLRTIEITPNDYKENNKIIIYIHGGAYVLFNADVTIGSCVPLADIAKIKVLTPDYTLAPHANFVQITDEIVKFYKALLNQGHKAKNIAIYGDSAGGSLACSCMLKLRDQKIQLPASLTLWSPWSDIDEIGDSYYSLKNTDPNLKYADMLWNSARAYADTSQFQNPYVSPVYGDFSENFPPTLIQVGSKEIFLSNAIRLYRQMKRKNAAVELDIYEGMWHVFQGYYNIPEAQEALRNTQQFITKHF